MSDGKEYYQEYSYQGMFNASYSSGSPPPHTFNIYQGTPSRIQTHFGNPSMGLNLMGYTGNLMQSLGPHHQKQMELAQKCRQETTPHHHARIAASQSRKNINIQSSQALAGKEPEIRSSEMSLGPRTPVIQEKFADWTSLDLSGMMISSLSKSLFQYDFLTCLYLNHNNLQYLPPEIGQLRNLVTLNLTGNKLRMLPVELGLVVSLKELLLFDNQIFNIPAEFGQLYQLEMLGLEGNPISEPIGTMIQKDGTQAVIIYLRDNCPMPQPPMEREWILLEEETGAEVFNVLCYNTLCEKYATPQAYAYTPSWALAWDYRKDLMLQEILTYNADIVCLQEIEHGQYEEFFLPQLSQMAAYDGVFYPKSRSRTMGDYEKRQVDGCATLFKRSKYKALDSAVVEFQQIPMQRPDLKKTEDMFNRLMVKDNIGVITLLEHVDSGSRICVANAHLHWDPAFCDVKIIQMFLFLQEIQNHLLKWNKSYDLSEKQADIETILQQIPTIICGDFNSLPESAVVDLLSKGELETNHPEMKNCDYSPLLPNGLKHKFSLKSSYHNLPDMEFTNFTPNFKGVIDYVWYSASTLHPTGLLSRVDKEYASRTVGFPNPHHPSDHIPLVVSFRRKQTQPSNSKKVSFSKK